LKKAKPAERKLIKEKVSRKKLSQKSLKEILIFIQEHGGIDYALKCTQKYISDAKRILNIFPESTEKDQLQAVADYILSRKI
jgi:octaprenyl-diphosphate synthase